MLSKLPLMLVSDTGYSTQRGQYRRRHRCNDLHNPLKSFLLRHNRLIDFLPFYFFTFKSVAFARNGRATSLIVAASVSAAAALRVVTSLAAILIVGTR